MRQNEFWTYRIPVEEQHRSTRQRRRSSGSRRWRGALFAASVCAPLLFSHGALAEAPPSDLLWREVTLDKLAQIPGTGDAQALALYELDEVGFEAMLRRAPMELVSAARAEGAVLLDLPMPDGSFARFRVEESPIMEPALAARFPEIRTYSLRGVDDPGVRGRLDRNHRDMHALLLSSRGTVQINPDRGRGHPYYRSIYERPGADAVFCQAGEASLGRDLAQWPDPAAAAGWAPEAADEPPLATKMNPSGATLRIYRLAVAATGEYYAGRDMGAGDADVLASIASVVNRVNAVYDSEVAIRFVLIADNDQLLFTDPVTDGYSNGMPCTMRNENTPIINATIDVGDYDVGHVFGSAGGGGCAGGSVVCTNANKGNGASGLRTDLPPDQEGFSGYRLVAHEMGHQFGAGHTWSGANGSCTAGQFSANDAYEPLSGTTLMAYSGICGGDNIQGGVADDPYFHTRSFDEIVNFSTAGGGNACALQIGTGNSIPVVDAGPDYTIPRQTPFTLTGSAADANDAVLSYAWEQFDATPARVSPLVDNGDNPLFRSFPAVFDDPSRTFPQLSDILGDTTSPGEILPTMDRTMCFRLTARDNRILGGGVDWDSMKLTVDGDPFFVISPDGGETLGAGCTEDVTWQVGGGDVASDVDLLLSTDGGSSFSPLVAETPNDGLESVDLPCNATSAGRLRAQAVDNVFFDVSDGDFTLAADAPEISASADGGEVDAACQLEVTFDATVSDDCSVEAADVDVAVSELTGNALLGAPTINEMQVDGTTVSVAGSVLVSDLSACPATVQLEVTSTDGCGLQTVETADADVVDSTPPTITPPDPIVLECTAPGGVPAADPDIVDWLDAVAAADNCSAPVVADDAPALFPASCPPGDPTTVHFTTADQCGNGAVESSTVTVVDTTPPDVSCEVAVDRLWPPNHKLVDVGLSFTATDVCDTETLAIDVTVTSDESPDQAVGAGGPVHCPDAVVGDDGSVLLRAERSGAGDGRVYAITVDATDACGNVGSCQVEVTVPKNPGAGGAAVDSGQASDATVCGAAAFIFSDGFESGGNANWSR